MPAIEDSLQRSGTAEVIVFLSPAAADSSAEAAGAAAGLPLGVADAGAMAPRAAPVSEALAGYFLQGEEVDDPERAGAALSVPDRRRRARSTRGSRDWEAIVNGARQPPRLYPNLGVMLGTVNEAGLEALRGDARVEKVTGTPVIELIRPSRVAAASTGGQHTWGIRAMRVPQLWAEGLTGAGVLVGHLDTGVDGEHPALREAISAFAAFDTFGRQVTPDPKPFDTDDHGTHTAATIAGREAGGRRVGVAPGAALASAVVIEGGQVVARVLGGMDWAVAQKARILNLSLGLRGFHDDFLTLTQRLRDLNILPVFAVGNEGVDTSRSPGNYGEALSVGAHDRFGRIPDFSSSQRFVREADALVPDLVAPGVGVVSARPGGGFQQMDGTSMATPHVAGLAALLMQARPDSTVSQVEDAIFRSCRRPGGMLEDRCNRGVPDAVRALAAL